jgi:Holliday junction resolvasome RuvABC endonuclease subunit
MYGYSAQEIRTAITGQPNAPKEQLAYDVMVGLGLIGQAKTAHEWEAMAVGHYHSLRLNVNDATAPSTPCRR